MTGVQTCALPILVEVRELSPVDLIERELLLVKIRTPERNHAELRALAETYEAKIVLDLMPSIYDRPGRVARILDQERDPRTVLLNAPFTPGPTGRPQASVAEWQRPALSLARGRCRCSAVR